MVVSFSGLGTQIGNRFKAGENEFVFGHGELGTEFLLLGIFFSGRADLNTSKSSMTV